MLLLLSIVKGGAPEKTRTSGLRIRIPMTGFRDRVRKFFATSAGLSQGRHRPAAGAAQLLGLETKKPEE